MTDDTLDRQQLLEKVSAIEGNLDSQPPNSFTVLEYAKFKGVSRRVASARLEALMEKRLVKLVGQSRRGANFFALVEQDVK